MEVAGAAKAAGYDWLFLDCEHGTLGLDAAAQIAIAALDAGIAPIARVPNGEYAIATRLLDNGVLGIVVPHVDTADEAREVVRRLKFPPVGHRSIGGIGPHHGLRALKLGDAAAAMNEGQPDRGDAGDPNRHRERLRRSPPCRGSMSC